MDKPYFLSYRPDLMMCECGSIFGKNNLQNHLETPLHCNRLKKIMKTWVYKRQDTDKTIK